jgi:hypothetical protein
MADIFAKVKRSLIGCEKALGPLHHVPVFATGVAAFMSVARKHTAPPVGQEQEAVRILSLTANALVSLVFERYERDESVRNLCFAVIDLWIKTALLRVDLIRSKRNSAQD